MDTLLSHSRTFSLFGLEISLYGTMIALGMAFGIACAFLICKIKGYKYSMPVDLALFALPFAIVGARLYYCIFNGVSSFWQIFRIWEGGMAIYGGVIGGFIGVLICSKVRKYSLLDCLDLAAPCLILGQAIGRIGCYFAGCCYGIETSNPALMVFPISVLIGGKWHLATFFYEAILNVIGFAVLMIVTKNTSRKGMVVSLYLVIYGLIRALLEAIRAPEESLMFFSTGIKVSQLLSILLFILGLVSLILILRKRKEREGGV